MLKHEHVIEACLQGIKYCDEVIECLREKKTAAEKEGRNVGFYNTSLIRIYGVREGYGGMLAWTLKEKDSEGLREQMRKHRIGDDAIVY